MQGLASLRAPTRLGWVVAACTLGGCGLVLDASPRTDAAAERDAASGRDGGHMDAAAPAEPDTGTDASGNVMTFDAIALPEDSATAEIDAVSPIDSATAVDAIHPVADDAANGADAYLEPPPDAWMAPMDALVSRDGALEVGAGSRDTGFDARFGGDSGSCIDTASCPVISTLASPGRMTCRSTTCLAGACAATGVEFDCPPAGGCVLPCRREGAEAVCVRGGSFCAGLGDACDVGSPQCMAGLACEGVACLPGMCLPACRASEVGMTMEIVLPTLVVEGTCNGHTYVPMGYVPPWCAGP